MIDLVAVTRRYGIRADVVFEIGACTPDCCHTAPFFGTAKSVVLFEALPRHAKMLRDALLPMGNITVIEAAVWKEDGALTFHDCDGGSFVSGLNSPAKVLAGYRESNGITVKAVRLKDHDPGNIDVLCIDTEGAEFYAIRDLVSKPRLICAETHGHGYVNPMLSEMWEWMDMHGYVAVDSDISDTVWVS